MNLESHLSIMYCFPFLFVYYQGIGWANKIKIKCTCPMGKGPGKSSSILNHLLRLVKSGPTLGGGGGIFPYVWPLRWCAAGQGIVFYLSVLNKVYNSGESVNRVLPGQLIWFVKFYLYSKYTNAMWLSNKMACICPLSFVLNRLIKVRMLS